ncbi:MAG: Tn3 family transposase [Cyanobacteria bacterium J06633_8]
MLPASFAPERSILDILCNVEHWLNWTRHFGPLSGSEPKFKQSAERYIFTIFSYGCNLGPNQMARHSRDVVISHMISYTNRRHISTAKFVCPSCGFTLDRDLNAALNLAKLAHTV